jgi:predicted unusual protein kinase regulating ubiquinone biosynthesis (AarF/ABC1/UbiB family)
LPNSAQQFWAQELLNSQGMTAKIGQILGQGKKTSLPVPSMTFSEAEKIFNNFFSANIKFTDTVFAASMGQVFVVTIDNKHFALKFLHPKIKKKIKKEIENILILGMYYAKAKGFQFDKRIFQIFLTEVFEQETDLIREGHFQQNFYNLFQSDQRFKLSEVIQHYSNEFMLCQEFVPCTHACDLAHIQNFFIFDFFFHSLLNHGLLHGDLNDRNWGINQNQSVVVYDFGCSQIVSERRINGLKKLLRNTDVKNAFKEFGVRLEATWFNGKEQELRDALFNQILGEAINPDWSISVELQKKFQDKIKILREYNDPWILLMMRSLFSLIRLYQSKGVMIPLGKIVRPYLEIRGDKMSASQIKVEVMENSEQVVYMTLPMTALDNMEFLMPEKVISKIHEAGINMKELIQKVKSTNFEPQDLFHLNIDQRSYRVWID